jgi:hypothetical protein
MKQYFKFDADGIYVEPVITSEIFNEENPMPDNWTDIPPIKEDGSGYFLAKINEDKTGWYETGEPPPVEAVEALPTLEEQVQALSAAVIEISAHLPVNSRELPALVELRGMHEEIQVFKNEKGVFNYEHQKNMD